TGNSSYIVGTEEKLALYDKEKQALTSDDMRDTIPALNAIRDAANIYTIGEIDDYAKLGLSKQFTIEEPGLIAYQSALKELLAPRIVKRLEDQLSSNPDDAEFMMDALKAYLMMGQADKRDLEFLKSWVNSDIQSTLAGSTETQAILTSHVNQLFAQGFPAQELSPSSVDMARSHLNSFPLAELVYTRLKEEAADEGLTQFNLTKVIGAGADELFNTTEIEGKKQIAGLYTHDGFKEYYLKNGLDLAKESTEQNWVLGPISSKDASDPEALNREVGQLLEHDFVEQWQALLNGIHIAEFRNIRHGVEVMQQLSGTNSPLKKLLVDVSSNTTLIDPPEEEGKSKVKVKNKLVKKAMRLAKKAKKLRKKKGEKVVAEPGEYVQANFLPLNTIATAGEGAQLNELLSLLAEVYLFLEEVAAVPNGKAAFDAATKIMKGEQDLLSRLKIKAARYPAPLKQWVKEISDNSWRVVLENGNRYINTVWKEEVVPDYNAVIKSRYPVFASTTREINLVEFSNFFGPEGTMEMFYNNYMSPFIISSGRNWSQKTMDGRGLGISRTGIATFQNANRIKKMFFGAGQLTPTVNFSLKPVDMDAEVTRFSLSLDGQRIDYRHGPTRTNKLQWPGPDGANQTRIRFETADGSSLVDTEDGSWAFYRILDKANVSTGGQRNQLKVSFSKKEYNARYTLTTDSGVNPFRRAELAKFRVSERL
ncbi:type VI secretion system membrane subunit TssM, partial [Pseudomonadota bacterium]